MDGVIMRKPALPKGSASGSPTLQNYVLRGLANGVCQVERGEKEMMA